MPKGLKRAAGALLIVFALYSLLGFLILPGVALHIANRQLSQLSTVPAKLERLELNPFSLELRLWGLRLGEPGAEQLGFQRLYANLELDSLWSGALHLTDLELEKSQTQVLFGKDGTLNLVQLFKLPPSPAPAAAEPPSQPFPLRIDRLQLAGGSLHFQDLRPSEPIDFLYDSLDLQLHNLSTLPNANTEMTLVAVGPQGGRIDWSGRLSLVPVSAQGQLKFTEGKLQTWWPYVRDAVPLALEQGVLSLSTDYRLDLSKDTELQLSNTALTLAPFAIKAVDGRPLAKLARLDISEASLDLVKQQVIIGKLRSQNLETWAAREADGELDWQKLFAAQPAQPSAPTPAGAANAAAALTAEPAPAAPPATAATPPAGPGKPWQVLLRDVQLRSSQIHLADRVPEQDVALEVGPLNLDLQDFDSLGQSPFTLKLDTGVGKQGRLEAAGQAQLSPTSAKLQVSSRDLDLRLAQAYLAPFIRLELRSGLLGSELAVDLQSTAPLAFSVSGRAEVNQLHSLDTLKERDFLKWQQLLLDGLSYQHGDRLAIAKVSLLQPYARFIINEDLTTNIDDLLIPQAADAANEPPPAEPAQPAAPALGIHIGAIDINDGSANFADLSLTPDFATAIQQLNGHIGSLDNRAPKPASVDVKGKVDRYAPVSIKGHLNPFDPLESLDLATRFERVELTTLTPYSGKFAGYRIRKGRLNLDLHYRIEKGQLSAENDVLVEQLQLGEKVDSPDAVDLPIRLAVALLKDSEGKIAIALPVSGNLNDPQFSVLPIVWKTLRNLVLRAAQAPFKFIAGLVQGGADVDLSSVPFAAGSGELDGAAQQALDLLAAALKERPALRLEVEGISAQTSDGPPLAVQRLEREYQSTYYKILQRRGDKVPAEASQLEVSEDEKAPLLEGIYRARLKQQPPAEWAELEDAERAAKLRGALLDFWGKSALLQRRLAQARAASIKAYLVDKGGLADERIYLLDVGLGQAQADGRVASALHLDSE